MKELHNDELEAVSGGLYNFFPGYGASKLLDGYWDWVAGGAVG
ncbi:bacteriocin [Alteromonas ponticola]|uniref:Bacteriocin n=1 Tax=Alteromonas ponticola TaxID=2720613 RepID=A0ABX1R2P5_9ALTE|nr:bacteriocin [Alteromonas ponticola]NMH59896.1 bacteriocin [Alteromonas ponticola]